MTQEHDTTTNEQEQPPHISHPRFAAFYERYACLGSERRLTDPLRQETAGQAYGTVLEVGAGTGLNFSWYHPERVEQVEVIEPDSAMLTYARKRARQVPVPIRLTRRQFRTCRLPTPPLTASLYPSSFARSSILHGAYRRSNGS